MSKRILSLILAGVMAFSLCACAGQKAEQPAEQAPAEAEQEAVQEEAQESPITVEEEKEEPQPEEEAADVTEESGSEEEAEKTAESVLPPYEYPGPELFYFLLYQYLIDEFGGQYEKADVTIPCPIIIAEDESDKDDIKVWGDFQIYNYNLNGDILETVSGGSYPGLIHLKSTDAGYDITGMELVGDGADFEPTAKEIFGKYYEDFLESSANEEDRDAIRAQIIANYVYDKDLSIKAFQDYGWDPVPLPEENIDSFYSILD
ncbi:MAG: hypothetical protein J6Y57_08525 [Lachnospiraceae bacterium]|nr:hypothetical protein [Lachnospiraceae bacterium]